jgi:hypothetical protein
MQESKPTYTPLPPSQEEETLPDPTKEVTPTPVLRSRVIFARASYNGEFSKLIKAAAAEGIEITMVSNRNDFYSEMTKPDVALLIYSSDSWSTQEDLPLISVFEESGGRVLFLYDHLWSALSDTFQDHFGVSILREEVINAGGTFVLEDTLPSFLDNLKVLTEGTSWILGSAYLETDIQGGEESYIESRVSGEDRLVFFSAPDKSVTFLLAVRANKPGSNIFFDNIGIEYGDNEKAALLLLNYLLEGGQN